MGYNFFKNTTFKNFSVLTIGSSISQLLGLIALIKIAKIFSPSDYGIYTFILTQSQLLMAIGDLGIRNIVIRSIARDVNRSKELLVTGIKIKILAIVIIFLMYIPYNYYWGNLTNSQLALLVLFSLLNCSSNHFESIFMGYQKMLTSSLINIGWSLIWVILIFFLPEKNINISQLFFLFTILGIIKTVVFFISLKTNNLIKGQISTPFFYNAYKLLKESWPYLSLVVIMLPVNYFSNNFLDINSTDVEIGYFNLANKLMQPVTMVIGFALSALFPSLSILWDKNPDKFIIKINLGFKLYILSALLLCFIFTIFSKEVILLLFSEKYLSAVIVCQLQVWFIFLMSINSFIGTIWGAINKEKLIFKTAVINALISTPFLYFGSKYGALGISYGYVISFTIYQFYIWPKFKKSIALKPSSDIVIWILVFILFILSYFFISSFSLWLRAVITVLLLIIFSAYFFKLYKLWEFSNE